VIHLNEDYPVESADMPSQPLGSVLTKKPAVTRVLDEQEKATRQLMVAISGLSDRLVPILDPEQEVTSANKETADGSPILADRILSNTRLINTAITRLHGLNRRLQI
jgi:hypothetical protein